jgi:integrase
LYLDAYYKGKRYYETLSEFTLLNAKTPMEKNYNKELLLKAEMIRAKRQLDFINGEYGLVPDFKKKMLLVDYFKQQMEKRSENESNYSNWKSTLKHLEAFIGKKPITISQVNEQFLEDWLSFLKKAKMKTEKRLSANTIFSYYAKLVACLRQALRDKLITFNPAENVKGAKLEETQREVLSIEEIQSLFNTECEDPEIKRAFLFSCLSGMRWSDIEKLKWSEVQGEIIRYRQKKTKAVESLPINKTGLELLGDRKGDEEGVFNIAYSVWTNHKLKQWILRAGITKKITFHNARHTYATLMLTHGTDIYMVSKLLGHTNVKTTQVYAKVVSEAKAAAVKNLPPFDTRNLKCM